MFDQWFEINQMNKISCEVSVFCSCFTDAVTIKCKHLTPKWFIAQLTMQGTWLHMAMRSPNMMQYDNMVCFTASQSPNFYSYARFAQLKLDTPFTNARNRSMGLKPYTMNLVQFEQKMKLVRNLLGQNQERRVLWKLRFLSSHCYIF